MEDEEAVILREIHFEELDEEEASEECRRKRSVVSSDSDSL